MTKCWKEPVSFGDRKRRAYSLWGKKKKKVWDDKKVKNLNFKNIYIYIVCVCVCNWVTLLYSKNWHNTVKQLYFNFEKWWGTLNLEKIQSMHHTWKSAIFWYFCIKLSFSDHCGKGISQEHSSEGEHSRFWHMSIKSVTIR